MTAKEVTSVRIDPALLKKAQDMGLNVSALFTEFLEQATKKKRCPTCGQKIRLPCGATKE